MISEMFSDAPLWALLPAQGTACIALGLTGSYLLRRRAARAHQVLFVAMLAAALMPGMYLIVKHYEVGVLVSEAAPPLREAVEPPVLSQGEIDNLLATELEYDAVVPEVTGPVTAAAVPLETTAMHVPWRAVLFACWVAATAALLGRLALRFGLGLRLLHLSETLRSERLYGAVERAKTKLGICGPVRLRCSASVRSPIIWCWTPAPVLLVQKNAAGRADEADWVGVFCHELAHWKRLDHLSGLFAELLTAAFPWHPLTWWAKRRLLTLSERVCDDWVVASGQIGVDYAESLLDLSPERQMAFLPTVVGKEKAMKERIRRIVKDRCGDPRIGARWVLLVSLLAVLAAVSVAFAQRRPERREAEQRQERIVIERREREEGRQQQELAIAGRRNVLARMLDQLTAQARETEAVLRERGDAPGEEGHILRSELEALCDHIGAVERELQNLERREAEEGVQWEFADGRWVPTPTPPERERVAEPQTARRAGPASQRTGYRGPRTRTRA